MIPVQSSNIDAIGFEKGPPAVMAIRFHGGGVYEYRGADEVVTAHHAALAAAESKGRHFTAHIRHDKRLSVTKVDKV
jgi:hypothetical protein